MAKVIGLISCNYTAQNMEGLTQNRPLAALPFGGRYRLLDFPLSNLVHSGIKTVGLITPSIYRPILDHLGSGKEWSLDRKVGGLFILPGASHSFYPRNNKFDLNYIQQNIDFLERDRAEYIIISDCSSVASIDFREAVRRHQQDKSEVTLLVKELTLPAEDDPQGLLVETDNRGRVLRLEPTRGKAGRRVQCFAGMLIMKVSFLLDIILGNPDNAYLDLLDVCAESIPQMRIGTYAIPGYFGRIYSKQSYFARSMELLEPAVHNELFLCAKPVLTRVKDSPPTKYGPASDVRNSLVSSGCEVQGKVAGSIVFRGVIVEAGASITNCIVMQRCRISSGAVLENVIIDKYAWFHPGTVLKGQESNAVVINKSKAV